MPNSDSQRDPVSEPTLLRNLMDCLTYNVYFKDLESRFVRVNGAMAKRLALNAPEAAAGKTDFDFFDDEHARQALADEQEIIRTGEPILEKEESEIGPDGERRWVMTTKMALRESDGAIRGTFGVSRDITRRKQRDQALIESEALYHTLVENLPLNVFRKNNEGRFTFCNQRLCASFGKPLDDIVGKTDFDFSPRELAEKYRRDDLEIIATGAVFEGVEEYVDAETGRRFIHVMKTAVRDHEGVVTGIQGVFLDITAEKEAELALRQNEQRYRALMETARAAIITATEDGRIHDVNPAAETMFGRSIDEIRGACLTTLMPERFRERHLSGLKRHAESGQGNLVDATVELYGLRKDGTEFPLELSLTSWKTADGQSWFAGILRDLTERNRADSALRDSEALYYSLVESIPLNVMRKDLHGQVTFGNRMFCETAGKPLEEILGKSDYELYPAALADKYRSDDLQVIETGKTLEKIEAHRTPDGRTIYVEVFKTPVRDAVGDIVGVQIIFWDVTARKEAEDALLNAKQELELRVQQRADLLTRANAALREGNEELARANAELQDFAYIASHDLQEPLRKIQSFSARIKDKFAADIPEQGQDYLTRMNNAAGRMSGLISDLLELSRITTKAKPFASVDLNAVAREVVSDLEARIEQTDGRIDLGDLPAIEGDRTQLRQLLQNLIGNALKFHRPDAPPLVEVHSEPLADASGHRIIVKDNGIGFDEKYASRIFTVFQRLHGKSAYEGTGIGLAICRKVVERHRGEITAKSAPGEGATFLITLPTVQADAADENQTTP